jgi:polar amino acid transport system substrate-binding protein
MKHTIRLLALAAVLAYGFSAQAAEGLPPLPESLKTKGVVRVGVKCDYPPDGYLDKNGKPVGIEVEMAKQLAVYAFGDAAKSELTCVTTANRVPTLQGGKVDLLIATIGVTDERRKVVDFSDYYAWASSSILVRKDSPAKTIQDMKGKKLIFIKGAWQIPWFEKNMPDITDMRLDTVSDALQALTQGRADGYAHDLAVQVGIAKRNPNVRMLEGRYQIGFRGAAVRMGEKEWLAYVNAGFGKMRTDGLLTEWIKQYEDPDLLAEKIELWDPNKAPAEAKAVVTQ